MSTFLKTIFRPISNRHFTNKKTSFIAYIVNYVPITFIFLFLAIFEGPIYLSFCAGIAAAALIDYFIFDALIDKVTWKLFWSHFYHENEFTRTNEQDAIKAFEKNPSEANRITVEKHLGNKQ